MIKIKNDHSVVLANFDLIALMLHLARSQMRVYVDRHFAAGHLAPHAMNLHAVFATEALRADVNFVRR